MEAWRMARLAYFDPALEDVAVGPALCSPQREGFEAEFIDFSVTNPVSRDIH
jgi:regulation of enolase protein 1 (concanavalin A-like superfamily)